MEVESHDDYNLANHNRQSSKNSDCEIRIKNIISDYCSIHSNLFHCVKYLFSHLHLHPCPTFGEWII